MGLDERELLERVVRETVGTRRRDRRRVLLGRLLVLVGGLLAWELAAGPILDVFFVSKPSQIGRALYAFVAEGVLLYHLRFTLIEALLGYLIGAAGGLLTGFLLTRSPSLYRILEPFVVAFYGIPRIALAPLFIMWFGIGINSKIAIAAVMVFFIVFMNTVSGIKSVSPQLLDVARVMGATERQLMTKIIFPAATPFILTGLQITVPMAMIGAIVGEFISANRGVGYLVNKAAGWFDTASVFAGIFALLLVVLSMNLGITLLEARLMRWRPVKEFQQEVA